MLLRQVIITIMIMEMQLEIEEEPPKELHPPQLNVSPRRV
jgi:hypothetical protein